MEAADAIFSGFGTPCPLPSHLDSVSQAFCCRNKRRRFVQNTKKSMLLGPCPRIVVPKTEQTFELLDEGERCELNTWQKARRLPMDHRSILKKLRKERLAIDQAISALERMHPTHSRTKGKAVKSLANTSRKSLANPVAQNASKRGKVISFPRAG